ncbi:MAG: phosphoribosylanthranilate isomerase [Gaiellales bacterium]|nr:MAG: phosphoribosylanthranilate isomerase [Gaiellales bacterium]
MQPRIKICGLTRRSDADAAAAAGAWALGAVFAPESPRRVGAEEAAAIFRDAPPGVMRVGVFVNASLGEMSAAASASGLTALQLHGEETAAFCREVKEATGLIIIKALRVSGPGSLEGVVQFDTDFLLLDTYHPGRRGGTGESFDWSLAAGLPEAFRGGRLILAGGLGPGNIAQAHRQVSPFALDVSSGIESAPGIKDKASLERLFEQVKNLDK